jgi:hypothetical protein
MFFRNGHGYQAIGAHKSWLKQAAETPNRVRLTNEGMRFDREWHLNTDPQGYDHWDMPNGQGEYYNPTFIRGNSSGLSTNTVVIYSWDQGFYLGEHGWFDKRFHYCPKCFEFFTQDLG